MERLRSLFEIEDRDLRPRGEAVNGLDGHAISKEYRTKMVDWMVEVCTSFRCSDRTWFLAVELFDRFLIKSRGSFILKN